MYGTKPFGELKYREILGRRMAYVDEGEGDAIVFLHGQPASSYAWRNVMPHLRGKGRLVACDMIGMGASEKLGPGPDRYRYAEQRDYLFTLFEQLELGERVVLVGHDWGAVLAFEWARNHQSRVRGIAHMEAIAAPLRWSDLPEQAQGFFRALRTREGERMVLQENLFIEVRMPGATIRKLSPEEMDNYRRPFLNPGDARRPTLMWPRSLPLDGEPADVTDVVAKNGEWLSHSEVPKLFFRSERSALVHGRVLDFVRTWPNQKEVLVQGIHAVMEDSPDEIGTAVADFVRELP